MAILVKITAVLRLVLNLSRRKTRESPKLTLNYIEDPTANGHAVNLRYANNSYLKLSGGTLTGNITLNNKSVFWKDAGGNEVAKITNAGFIKTTDMFRADRTADANTFESRRNGTTNAYIKSTGFASFKGAQFNGEVNYHYKWQRYACLG